MVMEKAMGTKPGKYATPGKKSAGIVYPKGQMAKGGKCK